MSSAAVAVLASLAVAACEPPQLAGDSPVLAQCALVAGSDCHVHLEVEDFDGDWHLQRNLHPYYGRGFMTSDAGEVAQSSLVATVVVPEGRYTVFARGFVSAVEDRSWRVEVGTSTLADTHGARGEGPGEFVWVRAGEVSVAGGDTEVRIVDRGESWQIPDAVVLTTRTDFDPLAAELAWRVFEPGEAESAALDEVIARAERYSARAESAPTVTDWLGRRDDLRARVLDIIGVDPDEPKSPLRAEVLGSVARDGYRIERLVFESRPDMPVTAHVYVPDGPGPFPAVVSPIGHYYDYGKMDHRSAARAHGLARQGILTLIYDAFGQGERDVGGHGHAEHWRLSLTGHTNLSVMVWDSIRALDYLVTRNDVDPERIAVTGASGGGLNTLYTSIADPRVAVAIPAVYVSQIDEVIASRVPHDSCTLIPELGGFTNLGEVGALIAPRPQLWMAAERDDFFPIDGAREAAGQAAAIYGALEAQDAFRFETYDSHHVYSRGMRQTLYGYLTARFQGLGEGDPIVEPALDLPGQDDAELHVFEGGKIPSDSVSPSQLSLRWSQEAVEALPGPAETDRVALRVTLKEMLRGQIEPFSADVRSAGPAANPQGLAVEKLEVRVAPGLHLPAYLYRGRPGAPVVVIVDSAGLSSAAPLAAAHRMGWSALYASVRGRGELEEDEWLLVSDNAMLGDPLLGQRAMDLVALRDVLRADPELSDAPAALLALGDRAGVAGLMSQGLYGAYDAAVIGKTPATYLRAYNVPFDTAAFVHRLLNHADLPQVAALAADRPLAWATDWGKVEEVHPDWRGELDALGVVPLGGVDLDSALEEAARLLGE